MTRTGACLLALLQLATAARQESQAQAIAGGIRAHSAEDALDHAQVVPAHISRAIRTAESDRAARESTLKAAVEAARAKKERLAEAVTSKATALTEAESRQTMAESSATSARNALMAAEKAASEHALHGEALQGALAELETSSQEAEQLAAAVADKEEKNNAAIAAMQAELQALKDQFDAKEEERTRAEAAMLDVKGKLMATSQFKADREQDQISAERAASNAAKELRESQASLDRAMTTVKRAEAEVSEAAAEEEQEKVKHENVSRSLQLLRKLKLAIETFYNSIDALQESMGTAIEGKAYEQIRRDENLAKAYKEYNLMINVFIELHNADDKTYNEVKPAVAQIDENYLADIDYICDPNNDLGAHTAENTDLNEKCGDGLWDAVGLTKLTVP